MPARLFARRNSRHTSQSAISGSITLYPFDIKDRTQNRHSILNGVALGFVNMPNPPESNTIIIVWEIRVDLKAATNSCGKSRTKPT
ncbi:MAG: hypothetical protein MUC60_11740, partial [Oscillatoria sp. Prado101]|nr:hypothetical protein [Oscillatoria sp. Prado101]